MLGDEPLRGEFLGKSHVGEKWKIGIFYNKFQHQNLQEFWQNFK